MDSKIWKWSLESEKQSLSLGRKVLKLAVSGTDDRLLRGSKGQSEYFLGTFFFVGVIHPDIF